MNNFLTNNWSQIALIVGGIFAWYGGRKHLLKSQVNQSNAEVTSANIDNVTATLDVYKNALDDLEKRFKLRIKELTEDLDILDIQNTELRKVIKDNAKYITNLITKLKKYEELEK